MEKKYIKTQKEKKLSLHSLVFALISLVLSLSSCSYFIQTPNYLCFSYFYCINCTSVPLFRLLTNFIEILRSFY